MKYIERYNELANCDQTVTIELNGDNPNYQTADPETVNLFNFWLWYITDTGGIRRQAVGIVVFNIREEDECAEWYDQIPVLLAPPPTPPKPSDFYNKLAQRAIQEQNNDSTILSIHLNSIVEDNVTRKFAQLTVWKLVSGKAVSSTFFVYLKADGLLGLHSI